MSVGAASSEGLNGVTVPSSKMTHSHGYWEEFSPCGSLQEAALLTWQLAPPRVGDPRESEEEPSYDLVLEATHHHFCFILLRSVSLNPARPRKDFQRISEQILKSPH